MYNLVFFHCYKSIIVFFLIISRVTDELILSDLDVVTKRVTALQKSTKVIRNELYYNYGQWEMGMNSLGKRSRSKETVKGCRAGT